MERGKAAQRTGKAVRRRNLDFLRQPRLGMIVLPASNEDFQQCGVVASVKAQIRTGFPNQLLPIAACHATGIHQCRAPESACSHSNQMHFNPKGSYMKFVF
jgi:hypothetical protein